MCNKVLLRIRIYDAMLRTYLARIFINLYNFPEVLEDTMNCFIIGINKHISCMEFRG